MIKTSMETLLHLKRK